MPKRDPEADPTDSEPVPELPPTVGERLRAAREQKKLTLEDVAAQTRIPQRHLASIESAEWDSLPAPTYTIGFAKNYAGIVGLDRTEIGDQLREEMGGQRFATTSADVFEPADPRRTMPKSLVIGAVIAAVLLIVLMSLLNRRSLNQTEPPANAVAATNESAPAAPAAPAPTSLAASGPVALTATGPAWIQVTDHGTTLFQGELEAGQSYTVPATATAPMLKAGKPESLKVTVGTTAVPQVGPAGKVTTVSLIPADLLKAPAGAAPASALAPAQAPVQGPGASAPQPRPRRRAATHAPVAPPAAPPPTTEPVTNTQ
jgi:cytoskeletal protein RodZ